MEKTYEARQKDGTCNRLKQRKQELVHKANRIRNTLKKFPELSCDQ